MEDMASKKEAILNLINALKQIVTEDAMGKPNEDPAHEAGESPELEEAEKASDVEMTPGAPEMPSELPEDESAEEVPEESSASPFASAQERLKRNLYKGGKSVSILAGAGGSSKPSKPAKGKFGR